MEANLVRILLLIALFFLLSSDYTSVVKQLVPTFEDGEEESDQSAGDYEVTTQIRVEKTEEEEHRGLKVAEENESE